MYHYTECGLDNVWLADGYHVIETPYGEAVSVDNARELHRTIALDLVNNTPQLSGQQFRFLRDQLDLTQPALAKLFGNNAQTIARWEKSPAVPPLANQLIRQIYLEFVGEQPRYTDTVNRVTAMKPGRNRFQYRERSMGQWEPASAA